LGDDLPALGEVLKTDQLSTAGHRGARPLCCRCSRDCGTVCSGACSWQAANSALLVKALLIPCAVECFRGMDVLRVVSAGHTEASNFDNARHYLHLHGEALLLGVAAITAIVVFIQWALQLRRRPEVAIRWAWDVYGGFGAFDQHQWGPDRDLVVAPRQHLEFRISFENIGDAVSEHTVYNVCAPTAFTMTLPSSWPPYPDPGTAKLSQGASNRMTGPCTFAFDDFVWMSGTHQLVFFHLEMPLTEGEWPLFLEIQSDRFNATGHRWLPSLVKRRDATGSDRSKWPRRLPGIIRRAPHTVEASLGTRSEHRKIVVRKGVQPHMEKGSRETEMTNGANNQIFDFIERTDDAHGRFSETAFDILNRAPGPYWDRVRKLVEAWFDRLCEESQNHVKARLRSNDVRQFRAGFWELYCHETLHILGYDITCEPELEGISRRPDFLVRRASDARFVMEATVVSESDEQIASDRREAEVLDVIDGIETDSFFLSLVTHSLGSSAPPKKRLRRELQAWLDGLDPEAVMRAIESDGYTFGPSVPVHVWAESGWHVTFRPLPIDPGSRGKPGLRPIGMRGPGEATIIDDVTPLRRALKEKAGAYGRLELPYIIATQIDGTSLGDTSVINALFGHEQVFMRPGSDGEMESGTMRAPDGFWIGPNGIQNRRVSAVLLARHLTPWTVASTIPTLWHNPWATWPVEVNETPWRIAKVNDSGGVDYHDPSVAPAEFFGLPPEWPGPESAWPD
jgi:hypothetical protein